MSNAIMMSQSDLAVKSMCYDSIVHAIKTLSEKHGFDADEAKLLFNLDDMKLVVSADDKKKTKKAEKEAAKAEKAEKAAAKKKAKEDKPKRKPTGWLLFQNSHRSEAKSAVEAAMTEEGKKAMPTEVVKELAKMWKALEQSERDTWNAGSEQVVVIRQPVLIADEPVLIADEPVLIADEPVKVVKKRAPKAKKEVKQAVEVVEVVEVADEVAVEVAVEEKEPVAEAVEEPVEVVKKKRVSKSKKVVEEEVAVPLVVEEAVVEAKKADNTGLSMYGKSVRAEVVAELTAALAEGEKPKPAAIIREIAVRWKAMDNDAKAKWG